MSHNGNGNMAHGLPNYYYTDTKIQQVELERIFRHSWLLVGREDDLAAGGDYFTRTICGEPIMVVRNNDGQINAMYNVCAHRGMRLAEGSGNYRRLYCPYHGWTYDLNGQLKGVPFNECLPSLQKENIKLQAVQLDTWGGFIFVNLDPEAVSLADYLGDMPTRWQTYHDDWEGLRPVKHISYDEPFNWKIFMENAVDYYHIPFIHQDTLDLPPVFNNVPDGKHFMLTTSTPEAEYTRYFDLLFPNTYFHIGHNKIQVLTVNPVTPDQCQVDVTFYQTPAMAAEYPINDPRMHRDINQILHEDFDICRTLQQQAQSTAYRILYTAHKMEEGVDHFDKMVLEALQ